MVKRHFINKPSTFVYIEREKRTKIRSPQWILVRLLLYLFVNKFKIYTSRSIGTIKIWPIGEVISGVKLTPRLKGTGTEIQTAFNLGLQ